MCDCSIFDRFGQLRGKVDSHANSNSETHCDTNTNRHARAYCDAELDTCADCNPDTRANTNADRELHPLSAPVGLWSYILQHKFA